MASEVSADGAEAMDPREWVLSEIDTRTEPDPDSDQGVEGTLWTSKERLVKHAGKFSTPVEAEPVETALTTLIGEREILYWHGNLTRATVPYLNAVVQSEQRAGVTRQLLIDKCREWLASKADGSSNSSATTQGGDRDAE
ncbi:hypothetical protein SG26_20325 (plasmid) [Haloarcula sp. CBA1115]|uniref:hypothetical protein n=1 Tax=Haloarcula sp. CBA1115 TaxID=1592728 RepID=UPI00059552A6|nr:hypothetical protein [Haloarcula sp. CBA1115]AJF28097.1 hypothetical protein SG26_20325 [Haloarcula sp. CBA1115]